MSGGRTCTQTDDNTSVAIDISRPLGADLIYTFDNFDAGVLSHAIHRPFQ